MITEPNNTGPLSSQEELGFRGTREVHQFFSAETEKMGGEANEEVVTDPARMFHHVFQLGWYFTMQGVWIENYQSPSRLGTASVARRLDALHPPKSPPASTLDFVQSFLLECELVG